MKPVLTLAMLTKIVDPVALTQKGSSMRARQDKIMENTCDLLNAFAPAYGLDRITNLSRFLGQVCIECDYFRTTQEYASGSAYEWRKDLGNTQAGDGRRFKGKGLIQTTGRYNTTKFSKWASSALALILKTPTPDFVANPEKLIEFPWAFWSAVYYWDKGNPTGRSLNAYAQQSNDEMITRRINGGLTHYDRRLTATANAALVLLGYDITKAGIKKFQADHRLVVDGIIGRNTRNALHNAMVQFDLEQDLAVPDPVPAEPIGAVDEPVDPAPEAPPELPVAEPVQPQPEELPAAPDVPEEKPAVPAEDPHAPVQTEPAPALGFWGALFLMLFGRR